MSLVVAFFGATAALVAATFSGLLSKWRRETLTNAYQDFIRISFDHSYSAVQAMLARDAAESTSIKAFRLREAGLHAQHESLLTRLKLLAPHEVVKAAQHLHESDHSLVDPALRTANAASGEDWTSFEAN